MAKIELEGIEKFTAQLVKLGDPRTATAIMKQTLYEGAGAVADEIRRELNHVLEASAYFRAEDGGRDQRRRTGALLQSLYISEMKSDDYSTYAQIGFAGYDSKGFPNTRKAYALEYGTSHQNKTPFIRPAIKRAKLIANAKMNAKMNELIKNAMEV